MDTRQFDGVFTHLGRVSGRWPLHLVHPTTGRTACGKENAVDEREAVSLDQVTCRLCRRRADRREFEVVEVPG